MYDLFIIIKIIFLILYYIIKKKCKNIFFNRRYSRIVENNIKFKVIKPKNILDVINIIKYANNNNFKITSISGGHSYYFLKEFPKFNINNLIIIDVCLLNKINYIKNNSYINIEAGVLAGDIKKFNNKLKNKYWCLHGNCDSVGLGFWINGGQHSGFNIYSYMSGICGSDCIKTINYVDAFGNYKSISKKNGDLFKAVKMIAGEFGCITSLDINLIKGYKLIHKCFVISTNNSTIKKIFYELSINKILNVDGITTQLALCPYNLQYIVCSYDPSIYTENIFKIIEKNFKITIKKTITFFSNLIINNFDWGLAYNIFFNNNWINVANCINNKDFRIVNNIIDLYFKNTNCVFWIYTCGKISENLIPNSEKDFIFIDCSLQFNDNRIDIIKNLYTNSRLNLMYFNEPIYGKNIEDYFSIYSPLSYHELCNLKKIYDPKNIFINRNSLINNNFINNF